MWHLDDVVVLEDGSPARGVLVEDRTPMLFREIGTGDPEEVKNIVALTLALARTLDGPVIRPHFGGALSDDRGFVVEKHVDGVAVSDALGRLALPLEAALYAATAYTLVASAPTSYAPSPLEMRLGWNGSVWMQVRVGFARRYDLRDHALLSPEAIRGERKDNRSVVFQAAVLAYWLAAGVHPIVDEFGSTMRVLQNMVEGQAVPLDDRVDVPRAAADVLDRCLSQDPDERPSSWTHVLDTCGRPSKERARPLLADAITNAFLEMYRADSGFSEYARHAELTGGRIRSYRPIAPAEDIEASLQILRNVASLTD